MDGISYSNAKASGLKRYFTGEPCPRGHIAQRYVCSRACVLCARELKKCWAAKNRGRIRKYDQKLYVTNGSRRREQNSEWRRLNPERARQSKKAEYEKNKLRYAIRMKNYRELNKDILRVSGRKKRVANPERYSAYSRNYKLRKRKAEGSHTGEDIIRIRFDQGAKCAYCRRGLGKRYHVDHIVALKNGGSNWPSNLQVLCPSCNQSKSAKDPITFAQSHGMLL